jgi:hypothetical protein
MLPFHSIQTFLQQATEKGSRSTILRPLGWSLSIWIAAILGAVYEKADFWLVVLFSAFAALTGLAYLGTYAYCLSNGKETLLRSETYSIQERLIDMEMAAKNHPRLTGSVATIDPTPTLIEAPREEVE